MQLNPIRAAVRWRWQKANLMDLPNYFIIDTQPEAPLSPQLITEACRQLKRNRIQYLRDFPTAHTITLLAQLAENWQDALYPFRIKALKAGQQSTGFSPESLARGLDEFFARITEDSLHNLVTQELGDPRRLDAPLSTSEERSENRSAFARGPELIGHITAGNLPCPTLMSLIHGLLVGSAQFVKCAENAGFIPRLFAHSIYHTHAKLGSCIELARWSGGDDPLEKALFDEADCVMAVGRDETLEAIRTRLPNGKQFLSHGHRVSFGYIHKHCLSRAMARELAANAARDVAAWNQLGCLSPHVFYVECDGAVRPEQFAEMLSEAICQLEQTEPRGAISEAEAGDIAHRRSCYEIREAHTGDVRQWKSEDTTAWTVVFEEEPQFSASCMNRFVHVKSTSDIDATLRAAEMVRGQASTVGLAAPKNEAEEIVIKLAHWGVTRVCPIGQMQNPPVGWRHDGRPTLGDLVTWTDWEM